MTLNSDGKSTTRIFMNAIKLILKHSFSLLLGQILFIGISIFILSPFVQFIFNLALSASGYSYITVNNLGYFILKPVTILILILLFIIIGLFFLFGVFYLITFYSIIEHGNTPKILNIFILSLKRFILTFTHHNFMLLPIVWLSVISTNIPLLLFALKNVRMFRYVTESIVNNQIARLFIIAISTVLLLIFLRTLFVFQYCILEGRNYKEARILSEEINSNREFLTFSYFVGWNVAISLFIYIIYIITMAITALFVMGITDKSLIIATFISLNERMSGYLAVVIFAFSFITNFSLSTHLFHQYKKEDNEHFSFDNSVENIYLKVKSYKHVIILFLMIIAASNIYFLFDIAKNGSPFNYVNLEMISITSHRGLSHNYPENTIPAMEKAIEEQSNYIEVDVRQTKDGKLVILHDESLKRTTGVNKMIWNMDYAEVSLLDAGIWMGEEYKNTPIPTLQDVFELCKGKVNLNLDLKYDTHIPNLESKVVAMIEEYDMEMQCLVSSTSLTTLENIKLLNSDIKTGYVTFQIYKDFYDNDNLDYFSLKSYFVSESIVQKIHKKGKEIHVWTVNTKKELKRMQMLGVDNIITNNPAYAKELIFEEDSNRLLVTLLKIIIGY